MQTQWKRWALLTGVLLFCTGASTEGIRQARDWVWTGDLALANGQPVEAYYFYSKATATFPGTPHGRFAQKRAKALQCRLLKPTRSLVSENPGSWVEDLFDFLTWP